MLETIHEEADYPEGSIDVIAWKGQRSRWGVGADSQAEQSHVFLGDTTSLLPWVECMDEHPMEVVSRRVPDM